MRYGLIYLSIKKTFSAINTGAKCYEINSKRTPSQADACFYAFFTDQETFSHPVFIPIGLTSYHYLIRGEVPWISRLLWGLLRSGA